MCWLLGEGDATPYHCSLTIPPPPPPFINYNGILPLTPFNTIILPLSSVLPLPLASLYPFTLCTQVMEHYCVPEYASTAEFVSHFAKKMGKLKKGVCIFLVLTLSQLVHLFTLHSKPGGVPNTEAV